MNSILIEALTNPDVIFIIRGNGEEISVNISKGKIDTFAILTKSEQRLVESKIKQRNESQTNSN